VLDGVKFGFDNAVDQLKVLNPRVELNTAGLVIPPEYAEMEEDEEEDEREDGEKGHEEGHDESDS
ncbi:hypothetical protein A2U01_0094843, partial [Trifolium medium]|nr:hypothetical protein [Trifolium medium]